MQSTEISQTFSEESASFGPRKSTFWIGLGIIVVVALAAVGWALWGTHARERDFEANLEKRLELIADPQVRLVETLMGTFIEQANRVINSELFKLYATEVDLLEDDVSLLVAGPLPGQEGPGENFSSLTGQLPMMQSLLIEFTRISGYLNGRVVNRNGTVYIATDATTTPLRADQKALVRLVLQTQSPQFSPLKSSPQGLVLEAFLPIFPPKASGLEQSPVAVLQLSKPVNERLNEMQGNALLEKGERIRLLQQIDEGYQEIVPWLPGQLQTMHPPFPLVRDGKLNFAPRLSVGGDKEVYSLGLPIVGTDWWIIVEADYDVVRESLRGEQKALLSIAGLLILIFGVTFGAVWAILVGSQERKLAHHFAHLAQQIDRQRQLLGQINNNIADYIVLEDLRGRYQYVNPAFAEAVGRSAEEMTGLDNEAIFGFDTAKRLEHSTQQVLADQESHTFNEAVYLQSKLHHLQISKAPLKDREGKVTGLVSVIRDVTDMVETQKRHEQATHKSVEALVRAVELTDPYLAGHSRLMGAFGVEVAKVLNAADLDISTIEIAANLCQVGKLFVDRNILFKSTPLTEDEKRELEKHVVHAGKVLHGIDFGLPVYEAVTQMNENLSGSGYPKGLKGEQISLPARVLAVVNSFCAMVQPRAYRGARPVEEILEILAAAGNDYDQRVVAALEEVVHSALGEKLLAREVGPA